MEGSIIHYDHSTLVKGRQKLIPCIDENDTARQVLQRNGFSSISPEMAANRSFNGKGFGKVGAYCSPALPNPFLGFSFFQLLSDAFFDLDLCVSELHADGLSVQDRDLLHILAGNGVLILRKFRLLLVPMLRNTIRMNI